MRIFYLMCAVATALGGAAVAGVVHAQQKAGDAGKAPGVVRADDPNHTQSMERLRQAADKLRQSIQEMADQPAGPRRNYAIDQAQEALIDTQRAMVRLPAELRVDSGSSASASSSATGSSNINYSDSMARLKDSAQRLRDAVQAMAQQPAGPKRNEAMDQAREALLETQQAMISLPPDLRK